MCQINACEFAANQSRLRETPLMLKLYFTDSNNIYYVINIANVSSLWSSGTAVEVHADGPVSIPIASKDEDILHGPY